MKNLFAKFGAMALVSVLLSGCGDRKVNLIDTYPLPPSLVAKGCSLHRSSSSEGTSILLMDCTDPTVKTGAVINSGKGGFTVLTAETVASAVALAASSAHGQAPVTSAPMPAASAASAPDEPSFIEVNGVVYKKVSQ